MSPTQTTGLKRAPLDVYKKVTIIRKSGDTVAYEDSQGKVRLITDIGDAALTATPSLQPKLKLDIPVPTITLVDSYIEDVPANYEIPISYIRCMTPTEKVISETIEYNLDNEDEYWVKNHPRFGTNLNNHRNTKSYIINVDNVPKSSMVTDDSSTKKIKKSSSKTKDTSEKTPDPNIKPPSPVIVSEEVSNDDSEVIGHDALPRQRPTLPLIIFELMLDLLEKATAFETIITQNQAERIIMNKIPQMHIFGSSSSAGPTVNEEEKKRRKNSVTARCVIHDVYNYWLQKRSKLKKPLLRKYWPVTSSNDTNPHLVFRPREKEKYKLRKKRQNDLDAYRKIKQLRTDFDKVRVLLDFVKRREKLNKFILDLQADWFDQRIYDMIDTSGQARESNRLCHDEIVKQIDVPKYFDTQNIDRGKKRKRKRSSGSKDTRSLPVPIPAISTSSNPDLCQSDRVEVTSQRVVASQENPPLFLHPLVSRESYAVSWDNAVPFVSSYVDSHPTPTFRFRHRPRIGRGGRIIIDRFPRPGNPDLPPVNVFTTGDQLPPVGRPLQLLPKPLNHEKLSRTIEEISAAALSDDEENLATYARNAAFPSGNIDESNSCQEVLVKVSDWLESDEQIWGEERFAIGPV